MRESLKFISGSWQNTVIKEKEISRRYRMTRSFSLVVLFFAMSYLAFAEVDVPQEPSNERNEFVKAYIDNCRGRRCAPGAFKEAAIESMAAAISTKYPAETLKAKPRTERELYYPIVGPNCPSHLKIKLIHMESDYLLYSKKPSEVTRYRCYINASWNKASLPTSPQELCSSESSLYAVKEEDMLHDTSKTPDGKYQYFSADKQWNEESRAEYGSPIRQDEVRNPFLTSGNNHTFDEIRHLSNKELQSRLQKEALERRQELEKDHYECVYLMGAHPVEMRACEEKKFVEGAVYCSTPDNSKEPFAKKVMCEITAPDTIVDGMPKYTPPRAIDCVSQMPFWVVNPYAPKPTPAASVLASEQPASSHAVATDR